MQLFSNNTITCEKKLHFSYVTDIFYLSPCLKSISTDIFNPSKCFESTATGFFNSSKNFESTATSFFNLSKGFESTTTGFLPLSQGWDSFAISFFAFPKKCEKHSIRRMFISTSHQLYSIIMKHNKTNYFFIN